MPSHKHIFGLRFFMEDFALATEVLEWAAKQAGESFDAAARAIAKGDASFKKVLNGHLTPSQAIKYAKRTRVPFGVLFLKHPPETIRQNIPDLRQATNAIPLSLDFFEVLEDATRKQEWFKEYLLNGGARPLDFVGSFDQSDSPLEVAKDIRQKLQISTEERQDCSDQNQYFRMLSLKAEDAGILVLKSGIVKSNTSKGLSPREFRGFALSDPIAPLVFVNGKDWEVAFVFTLLHEISHIWIGQSGVSDFPYKENKLGIEAFCNKVAAEVLVPEAEFNKKFFESSDLGQLAKYFKVSRLVIARRAYDLKKITKDQYSAIAQASANSKPPVDDGEGGGNPYATYPVRNSKRLTSALVGSAISGQTLLRDAATLLNIKTTTVISLSQKMKIND